VREQTERSVRATEDVGMNTSIFLAAFTALGISAGTALACYADADCSVGSRCVKQNQDNYGSCRGGLAPGNDNDLRPVHPPNDTSRKDGNNCAQDTDCGPESACSKESGFLEGICAKRKNESPPAGTARAKDSLPAK
jgi:hypothetical protein